LLYESALTFDMSETSVVVVPEKEEFIRPVSREGKVWINLDLGEPNLGAHEARYLAPYWLEDDKGAMRVYHILGTSVSENNTEIELGNSFILPEPLRGESQRRRFYYVTLSKLGMVEVCEGLLVTLPASKRGGA